VESRRLNPELASWRWGQPEWYLSSAAASDAEILNRVYYPSPWAAPGAGGAAAAPRALAARADAGEDTWGKGAGPADPEIDLEPSRNRSRDGSEGAQSRAGGAEAGLPPAENPKYRAQALAAARRARAAGRRAARGAEVAPGLRCGLPAPARRQFFALRCVTVCH
jgi:hypothetical protein